VERFLRDTIKSHAIKYRCRLARQQGPGTKTLNIS